MSNYNCTCRGTCLGASFFISLIVGIVTAFLVGTEIITLAPLFLWILAGIALAFLAIFVLSLLLGRRNTCLCRALPSILIGILGTILSAVILIAFSLGASILGAIFSGLLLFFFALLITASVCLAIACSDCAE